jgi:hypothetical protein
MPLPTPNDKEKKSDFVSRCLLSEVVKKDFKSQDQRVAVCYSQYEEAKNKSKAVAEFGDDEIILMESNEDQKNYDHEMTISKESMEELHEKGETYITETDGDETMVIKVKYQS